MPLRTQYPPPTGVAMSSVDHRRALRGAFIRNSSGVPRAGVFPPARILVSARASMGVNIAPFSAVLVRDGLPAFAFNDGDVLPIGAAPAANSRFDIVYAKQHESSSPFADLDNIIRFAYVSGDASATPDLAAAIALVPEGGLLLASVLVPAGATTTQSAGVQISQLFDFTAMAGGVVQARTFEALRAWTNPLPQQVALVVNDTAELNGEYVRSGSNWVPMLSAPITGFGSGWSAVEGSGYVPTVRADRAGRVELSGLLRIGNNPSRSHLVTIPTAYRPTDPNTRAIGTSVASNGVVRELFLDSGLVLLSGSGYVTDTALTSGSVVPLHGVWWRS